MFFTHTLLTLVNSLRKSTLTKQSCGIILCLQINKIPLMHSNIPAELFFNSLKKDCIPSNFFTDLLVLDFYCPIF